MNLDTLSQQQQGKHDMSKADRFRDNISKEAVKKRNTKKEKRHG